MDPSNENNQTSTPDVTISRPSLQISQLISENENNQTLTPESLNSESTILNQSQLRNENDNQIDSVIPEHLLRTRVSRQPNVVVGSVASSSSSDTIYTGTRTSRSQLDMLVYNAIIKDDVQSLANVLNEYPDYDLNRFINPIVSENFGNTDSDIKDSGKTPLMIAAYLDCQKTVNYLLKSDVEVDLQGIYIHIYYIYYFKTF
ncbi:hypothetical protein C2G38_1653848 [Gigaspora rosea]|uniref:Uncharacterized protein n=1 Tax=Gigaspora rosea TaxID=44941 RepID=A0A397W1F7_9GLOM|nr:hypothetical protein C2G38_1653848 [Gigaspora rosea]